MRRWAALLGMALALMALAGCGGPASSTEAGQDEEMVREVLDTSYPDALDVRSQLALGTLQLEGTAQAVTPEQAGELLPLWRALQGVVTDPAEVKAVLRAIEGAMSAKQLHAIAALRLTVTDGEAWLREQGPGVQVPAGNGNGGRGFAEGQLPPAGSAGAGAVPQDGELPAPMGTRQAEFASMSEEERAALRATAQASGMPSGRGGAAAAGLGQSTRFLVPLLELLAQRAAKGAAQPTATGLPVATPAATATPLQGPTPTAVEAGTATEVAVVAEVAAPAATPVAEAAETPAGTVELERRTDNAPAPPLTIEVDSIRIDENGHYELLGTVRNDGAETYEGIGLLATFYVERQCSERVVRVGDGPGEPGQVPTSRMEKVCDPDWYGPVEARLPCPYLEPGSVCAFSVETYGRDYVAYELHPFGQPVQQIVWRQAASLAVSDVRVWQDALGAVHIGGMATNENRFVVRDVTAVGALLDGEGKVVSVGSAIVLGDVAPGEYVSFDVRIGFLPYSSYELIVQGTQV